MTLPTLMLYGAHDVPANLELVTTKANELYEMGYHDICIQTDIPNETVDDYLKRLNKIYVESKEKIILIHLAILASVKRTKSNKKDILRIQSLSKQTLKDDFLKIMNETLTKGYYSCINTKNSKSKESIFQFVLKTLRVLNRLLFVEKLSEKFNVHLIGTEENSDVLVKSRKLADCIYDVSLKKDESSEIICVLGLAYYLVTGELKQKEKFNPEFIHLFIRDEVRLKVTRSLADVEDFIRKLEYIYGTNTNNQPSKVTPAFFADEGKIVASSKKMNESNDIKFGILQDTKNDSNQIEKFLIIELSELHESSFDLCLDHIKVKIAQSLMLQLILNEALKITIKDGKNEDDKQTPMQKNTGQFSP